MARPPDGDALADTVHSDSAPSEALGFARTVGDGEPRAALALERGSALGDFMVLDRLGSGGMGVVVSAYDPKLDRKVAIKVLLPRVAGEASETRGRQRLLREAQAMAKLDHPNVIAVHEVGTAAGQIFVVMDYVDGSNLRDWLAASSRSWREIVDVFSGAGRGLAAAHRAGMVHRDFKPDNVLITADGERVRVTDFGLVSTMSPQLGPESEAPREPAIEATSTAATLTRTGALLGTPLYMAPEQHLGRGADTRADQFAFCVSLYEALFGQRPFAGDTYPELADNVKAGAVRAVPHKCPVPRRIVDAVLRGLRPDPDERFATMEDLLDELRLDSRARLRWVVALGGGAAVLALVVALAVLGKERQAPRCQGGEEKLAGIWDQSRRAEVRAAFNATKRPYAGAVFDRVALTLDRYRDEWLQMWRDNCEATHVRGDQSAALLDLRVQCLDRRLDQMRALTAVLADSPEVDVLDSAVHAVGALPRISECADTRALTERVPLPADAGIRERIREVERTVDRAAALERAAKYKNALAAATEAAAAADGIGYSPLSARALLVLGQVQQQLRSYDKAIETVRRAAVKAAAAQDDRLAARAWLLLLWIVGHEKPNKDLAPTARTIAVAMTARSRDHSLQIELERILAGIALRNGEYAEAHQRLSQVLEWHRKQHGPDHLSVGVAYGNLAIALTRLGKYDEAYAHHERSLAIKTKAVGADHPLVAASLGNLAALLHHNGKNERALELFRKGLAIHKKIFEPGHPSIGDSLNSIGLVLKDMGKPADARRYLEEALAQREKALGENAPSVATSYNNLALFFYGIEQYDLAEARARRGLTIREKIYGANHPFLADSHNTLARIARAQGKLDDALAHYRRALELRRAAWGPEHPKVADVLNNIGYMYYKRQRFEDALPYYQQANSIYDRFPAAPTRIASLLFYGDTLAELGRYQAAASAFQSALHASEKRHGSDDLRTLVALVGLGTSRLDSGMKAQALATLRRAVKLAERKPPKNKAYLAMSYFGLARALIDGEPARAKALARKARDLFAGAKDSKRELQKVRRWLKTHR